MSRADRVRTVTRIRELQERMAEVEVAQRARDAEERRVAVDRSVQALSERQDDPRPSFHAFARRQTELDGALIELGHRRDLSDASDRNLDVAYGDLRVAHQRHEAIGRLLERVEAEEFEELARLEQAELDELAIIRRGAATPPDQQEDRT